MNCPRCQTGLLEIVGKMNVMPVFNQQDFPSLISIAEEPTPLTLNLHVCSREDCACTILQAEPEFLKRFKKIKGEHYHANNSFMN